MIYFHVQKKAGGAVAESLLLMCRWLSPHPSIEGKGKLYPGGFVWLGVNDSGEGKGSGRRVRGNVNYGHGIDV